MTVNFNQFFAKRVRIKREIVQFCSSYMNLILYFLSFTFEKIFLSKIGRIILKELPK